MAFADVCNFASQVGITNTRSRAVIAKYLINYKPPFRLLSN